jgi:hypothetical protein
MILKRGASKYRSLTPAGRGVKVLCGQLGAERLVRPREIRSRMMLGFGSQSS